MVNGNVEGTRSTGQSTSLASYQRSMHEILKSIDTAGCLLIPQNSPAKPSRPSRAYLHLTKQECITIFSEKVRNTAFEDAKASSKDSALLGPPSVEFSPYGRVPNSRPRKDARQGTIDQDPEFIDFLESLTNPVLKQPAADQENDSTGRSKEKVTVTPLVQFLKDKKANKGKENAAASKGAKNPRQDSKDSKVTNATDSKSTAGSSTLLSPKKRSAQAVKVEQAARDAVKVLNKQAAVTSKGAAAVGPSPTEPLTKSPTVTPNTPSNAALAEKKRERGNASAAAKILQRDLGLGGNVAGRGGRRGPVGNVSRPNATNPAPVAKQDGAAQASSSSTTNPTPENKTTTSSAAAPSSSATSGTAKATNSQPPTGPAASRPATNISQKPIPPPSTATQAFLKHANPSQGITEPLLEEAFVGFGSINKVEIDKKKGFAYVEFAEPESLQKAIKASPIKVAQGQVVVLERKTGPNLQARNLRGGPMMGNRGGGMPMGGRGGSMRGRGGFSRGGANMPITSNARHPSTAATANPQAPAATNPATGTPIAEGSTNPSKDTAPVAAPSAPSAPAD